MCISSGNTRIYKKNQLQNVIQPWQHQFWTNNIYIQDIWKLPPLSHNIKTSLPAPCSTSIYPSPQSVPCTSSMLTTVGCLPQEPANDKCACSTCKNNPPLAWHSKCHKVFLRSSWYFWVYYLGQHKLHRIINSHRNLRMSMHNLTHWPLRDLTLELVNFKLILTINILSIFCKIAIRWMPQHLTDH